MYNHTTAHEAHVHAFFEAQLDAVIEVGDDHGRIIRPKRSEGMQRLHTDDVTGRVRIRDLTARGNQKRNSTTQEPTSDLGNSMNDPDLLGLYAATPKEAEIAKRERGAVFGLDSSKRPRKTNRAPAGLKQARMLVKRGRPLNDAQRALIEEHGAEA